MKIQPIAVVIDDDVAVLSAIEDIPEAKIDFLVQTFRTYREAIHMLSTGSVDVVIAVIILGTDATGIDVCVAAVEQHPHVALVLISADSARDHGSYPGRTICPRKPVSAAELMDAIARAQKNEHHDRARVVKAGKSLTLDGIRDPMRHTDDAYTSRQIIYAGHVRTNVGSARPIPREKRVEDS